MAVFFYHESLYRGMKEWTARLNLGRFLYGNQEVLYGNIVGIQSI